VFPEILVPDIRFRGSFGHETVGFDALAVYVSFIKAFSPDFHNEIVATISDGARTFVRLSYSGTHRGEVLGVPATGRRFEYSGAAVFTMRGALIGEIWVLGDIYSLLRQLEH
jgi:predicted ester cyclase